MSTPAGFWRRYAAWSLDWLLLAPLLGLALAAPLASAWRQLQALDSILREWLLERMVAAGSALPSPLAMAPELLRDPVLAAQLQDGIASLDKTLMLLLTVLLGVAALYFIGFEASPWRATPGKRLLRLQVCALDGGPAGLARVALRFLAGGLSWLLLNLGHAIAGWRADHRALHDLIAGTQVRAQGPMPRWARLWLIAQFALLLALLLGLVGRLLWLLWQLATL